ncbi:MAG: histidine phosphatase family protein [Victivallales bacterium]|nr:histidine phosphatase family protein [Victivallales bacterium]
MRYVLLLIMLFVSNIPARTIYVVRHGQVGYKLCYDADTQEEKLTELGKEQARLLAKHLVEKCNFRGEIYSSPLYRAIQTASFTAKLLGKKIKLEPGFQEENKGEKSYPRGMSNAEVEERFPGLTCGVLPPAWRVSSEDEQALRLRVEDALLRLLESTSSDLLLVGHGATVKALVEMLNRIYGTQVEGYLWNCCLFVFEIVDGKMKMASYTTEYMPDNIVTSNFHCPKIPRPNDTKYAPPGK